MASAAAMSSSVGRDASRARSAAEAPTFDGPAPTSARSASPLSSRPPLRPRRFPRCAATVNAYQAHRLGGGLDVTPTLGGTAGMATGIAFFRDQPAEGSPPAA